MGDSDLHGALKRLVQRLEDAGIDYAIAGALALNAHGYRRMTLDIDVLLTSDGLSELKAKFLGRGYVERFPGSRGLRDTRYSIDIDVLIAGDYPGDGEPKPVAFPDPADLERSDPDVAFLPVKTLIELKLASGLTAPHRLKDLADVLELIRAASLPRTLADDLDAFVRPKYVELWKAAQQAGVDQPQ